MAYGMVKEEREKKGKRQRRDADWLLAASD